MPVKWKCARVQARLWDLAANRLTINEAAQIRRHIDGCTACRAAWTQVCIAAPMLIDMRTAIVPESMRGWAEVRERLSVDASVRSGVSSSRTDAERSAGGAAHPAIEGSVWTHLDGRRRTIVAACSVAAVMIGLTVAMVRRPTQTHSVNYVSRPHRNEAPVIHEMRPTMPQAPDPVRPPQFASTDRSNRRIVTHSSGTAHPLRSTDVAWRSRRRRQWAGGTGESNLPTDEPPLQVVIVVPADLVGEPMSHVESDMAGQKTHYVIQTVRAGSSTAPDPNYVMDRVQTAGDHRAIRAREESEVW